VRGGGGGGARFVAGGAAQEGEGGLAVAEPFRSVETEEIEKGKQRIRACAMRPLFARIRQDAAPALEGIFASRMLL